MNKERMLWTFALIMAIALPRAWAYTGLGVNFVPPADADSIGAVCVEKSVCPSTTPGVDGGSPTCNPDDYRIYGTMCGIAATGEKFCKDLSTHVPLSTAALKTLRAVLYNLGTSVFPGTP